MDNQRIVIFSVSIIISVVSLILFVFFGFPFLFFFLLFPPFLLNNRKRSRPVSTCSKCGAVLHPEWRVCPYCETRIDWMSSLRTD